VATSRKIPTLRFARDDFAEIVVEPYMKLPVQHALLYPMSTSSIGINRNRRYTLRLIFSVTIKSEQHGND
jgi:hypothetical protein